MRFPSDAESQYYHVLISNDRFFSPWKFLYFYNFYIAITFSLGKRKLTVWNHIDVIYYTVMRGFTWKSQGSHLLNNLRFSRLLYIICTYAYSYLPYIFTHKTVYLTFSSSCVFWSYSIFWQSFPNSILMVYTHASFTCPAASQAWWSQYRRQRQANLQVGGQPGLRSMVQDSEGC